MALLQARSEMYFKFVRKKSFVDIDSNSDSSDVNNDETKKKIERQLLNCGLCQSVQELMSEYIFFEEFYMTQNIRYTVHILIFIFSKNIYLNVFLNILPYTRHYNPLLI